MLELLIIDVVRRGEKEFTFSVIVKIIIYFNKINKNKIPPAPSLEQGELCFGLQRF
ncbi:MAG: hypothetical protein HFJ45_07615 [Clostridia bacterium]|nr:hypothetical protein [Clostridia bacterium]